jgi:hypothetical protein
MGDQHRFDRTVTATAVLGIDGQAGRAEIRQRPTARTSKFGIFGVTALMSRIFAVAKAAYRIAQSDVIFSQREIHIRIPP